MTETVDLRRRYYTREVMGLVTAVKQIFDKTVVAYKESIRDQEPPYPPMRITEWVSAAMPLYAQLFNDIVTAVRTVGTEYDFRYCITIFANLHVYICHVQQGGIPTSCLTQQELIDAARTDFEPRHKEILYAACVHIATNTTKEMRDAGWDSGLTVQPLSDDAYIALLGYMRRAARLKRCNTMMSKGLFVHAGSKMPDFEHCFSLRCIAELVEADSLSMYDVVLEQILFAMLPRCHAYNMDMHPDGVRRSVCMRELWSPEDEDLAVVVEKHTAKTPTIDPLIHLEAAMLAYFVALVADQTDGAVIINVCIDTFAFYAPENSIWLCTFRGAVGMYADGIYHVFGPRVDADDSNAPPVGQAHKLISVLCKRLEQHHPQLFQEFDDILHCRFKEREYLQLFTQKCLIQDSIESQRAQAAKAKTKRS